ncbi:tRNA (adenosine(37)-N6)-threonylcarbamoyltransferase complex transferase subunit TsaD, partial [Patescibacteria group bacterium]|nr:tRNA (adenosine(37)-N6)-threonylcarbamoyltransferase complex transferase subunit TsaD [Patescibacteria group bacterium]
SFQKTVVDILLTKFGKAADKYQPRTMILAGGVAANSLLRRSFEKEMGQKFPKAHLVVPEPDLCTDNAVMIAWAAEKKYQRKEFADLKTTAEPNMAL